MEIFDIKFVIFREKLNLLLFIKNQRSEKSRNEHFAFNHKIDGPNEVKILKKLYIKKLKRKWKFFI